MPPHHSVFNAKGFVCVFLQLVDVPTASHFIVAPTLGINSQVAAPGAAK